MKADGILIQAESVTGEIYSSIDEVSEKLDRQIKKYKEKLVSHRKSPREGRSNTRNPHFALRARRS